MNVAVTLRLGRESLWPTLIAAAAIVFFVVLFVWAMQMMGPPLMEFLSSVGFLRRMLELAYGISLEGDVSSNVLYSIAWLHPVILALAWGTLIATATRQTSGEVERGTAELLLTLPLSRLNVLLCGIACWSVAALVLSLAPLGGVWLGTRMFEPLESIQMGRFAIVMVNFLFLNLTVAALATVAGCCLDRRGVAISLVAGLLLVGVAMNFLESFLPVIERIRFLNLLHYYQPSDIVREGTWPIGNLLVLATISGVSLVLAGVVWTRRDIPAH